MPFGNATAHLGELLRILEKLDHLGNLLLRLVATRDIGKRDLVPVTREQLRPALAEAHGAAAGLAQLPHKQEIQQADDDHERDHLRRDRGQQGLRRLLDEELGSSAAAHVRLGHATRRAEVLNGAGLRPAGSGP
jgi:hypothetical protein